MKRNVLKLIAALALFIGYNSFSQTTNHGNLKVSSGTEVSTYFDFVNTKDGNVLNDGSMYFYGDYQNQGLFSYTTNSRTGYVVFEGKNKAIQSISGSSPSSFYDVLFNKSGGDYAFHLTNDIATQGTVNLADGIVYMDKANGGAFVFLKGATHVSTSDKSHVDGEVTKKGTDAFKYPIGDKGYYRFASISAPAQEAEIYTGEYLLEDSNNKYPHASRTGVLQAIDNKEYWVINQSEKSNNSVIVSLSYDKRTTPQDFVNNAELLHVVRWDEKQKLWVDEGGVVDLANQTVTTPVKVEGFGIFTLGTVKKPLLNPGDVVIYNGVTPDGDGMNDYFIIDNINYFPNNHVSIYNRWGRKVYETQGYDSKGNVFKGMAEGVDVVGKGEKLPTGTYYYVVEYLYDRDGQSQWVKKVGYLHLENND
ncbi:gliding motility-associated C-terminal domain-containing protein [Flavobacterium sp. xlx-214]|uniref:gliding motility-associated C-terminal domain-containing protein n=1 Tax=Flavobacterium sp. xlx-214 TaxID=2654325 RepID=UPI0015EFC3E5|nr:gliding motility-associated C-terminal domain-containing protein [Flavobacterium sp. xlx-214]QMI83304.1 gliding motility-associated C-terminal domain-containing protein [Flavobacterium sp. xlx-214]